MIFESLGDRMKYYEKYNNDPFPPNLPVVCRLDGKGFHNYTRGFNKPFDGRLHDAMDYVCKTLIKKTHASVGYTQSDEITLVYVPGKIYFDGKPQKLSSVLASMASVYFNEKMKDYSNNLAFFDCRSFFLPSLQECINCLIWREQDAVRNSIQMAARSIYSHNECNNKSCSDLQDMLFNKGINWNNYSIREKRGNYFVMKKVKRKLTAEELKDLPEKHEAVINPDKEFERRILKTMDFIKLSQVENQLELLFGEN